MNNTKKIKVISELASKNELLQVVNTLHEVAKIEAIHVVSGSDSDNCKHEVIIVAHDTTLIIRCKSIGVARMMAKTIEADTGAVLIMEP